MDYYGTPEHRFTSGRYQSGFTAIRPQRPRYATSAQCSCGRWRGKSNEAPSKGGLSRVRDAHREHVAKETATAVQVYETILATHVSDGRMSCGYTTDGPIPHRHSNALDYTDKVMTCSEDAGHEGPHKDSVCCYRFESWEGGVPGTPLDRQACASCKGSWPCAAARVLIAAEAH